MQKFQEGDLIIRNNKVYMASWFSEKETVFRAVNIRGLCGYKGYALFGFGMLGTNEEGAVSSTDFFYHGDFRCAPDRVEGKIYNAKDAHFPIIGKKCSAICSPVLLDTQIFSREYPEIYREWLVFEQARLSPPKPSAQKSVAKKKTKKK